MPQGKKEDKVPSKFVILGGAFFVFGVIISPLLSIVGILDGIYILRKYPHKKIHGIIPLVLNVVVLLSALWAILYFAFNPLSLFNPAGFIRG